MFMLFACSIFCNPCSYYDMDPKYQVDVFEYIQKYVFEEMNEEDRIKFLQDCTWYIYKDKVNNRPQDLYKIES